MYLLQIFTRFGEWTYPRSLRKIQDTYNGESYAGKAIYEGVMNGKGWEDGLLKNAKFRHPRQICFTDDGKMYIARQW